ncbi:hypothetical protein R3P38DRAFT_3222938 [Favolaschia claudopus]|uniref:Uncharacterized protein n=1 Tax=Favolaschia claudopus TaxID=2862362 RepID=A0AAV9ZYV9_9AGAR
MQRLSGLAKPSVRSYLVCSPVLRVVTMNALTNRTRRAPVKNGFGSTSATFAVAPPAQFRSRNAPGSTPLYVCKAKPTTEVRRLIAVVISGLTAGVVYPPAQVYLRCSCMLSAAGVSSSVDEGCR